MNLVFKKYKSQILIFALILSLFIFKLFLNNFLLAENGDTYDFFRISYELKQGNFLYESKRLPLYSALLTPFNPDYFVFYGRIINNLIYFLSVFFFYKLIGFKFNLNLKEKFIFTAIFAFNFIIFDNSFFILSDSLLLLLSVIFLYFYEKNSSIYLLSLVSVLAFYTRFEGLLLAVSWGIVFLVQKKYSQIFKFAVTFIILSIPLFLKLYLASKTGSTYLDDEVGFTLKYQNVLKAFGSLFFGTGGFWLLCLFILDKKTLNFAKNPLKFFKENISNIYPILFILFSALLILWGFFIRLYSVPVLLTIIYIIYLYKNNFEFKKSYFWPIIPLSFYLLNLVYLRHFDLAYFMFGKGFSILLSLIVVFILVFSNLNAYKKLVFGSIFIVILNLGVFIEKFVTTREKYHTIVQASEFVLQNNLQNVAWFDESGVQKWYFKDFAGQRQYFNERVTLDKWLLNNKIDYMMVTDELGYRIGPIMEANKRIKQLEKVAEFNSGFAGGRTQIYKLVDNKLPKK